MQRRFQKQPADPDLAAPLRAQFSRAGTQIRVFSQNGWEKKLERCKTAFQNPIIHERDLRREELPAENT